MKKTLIAALAAVLMVGLPLPAQSGKVDIKHLDKLSSSADEYIEVALTNLPLKWALKLVAKEDPEAYELLKPIKGIYVRVIAGSKKKKSFSNEDIELIKKQISVPPWERMVMVKDGSEGDINVFVLIDPKTEMLKGLVVLVVDDSDLVFVNLVGDFDPDNLGLLDGKFGIPPSTNLGGAKKKKDNDKEPIATTPQKGKTEKDGEPDPKPIKEETTGIELG